MILSKLLSGVDFFLRTGFFFVVAVAPFKGDRKSERKKMAQTVHELKWMMIPLVYYKQYIKLKYDANMFCPCLSQFYMHACIRCLKHKFHV